MSLESQTRAIDLEKHAPQHPASGGINVSNFKLSCARSLLGWMYTPHSPKCTQDHLHAINDYNDPNINFTAFIIEDESPYAEVQSVVTNTDDPTMLLSTFRTWVVGLIWSIITLGTNQVFYFRYPTVILDNVCLSMAVESICVLR